MGEVVEPPDQLRRVGAEAGQGRVRVHESAGGLAEGALGVVVVAGAVLGVGEVAGAAVGRPGPDRALGEADLVAGEIDEVVVGAGVKDDPVEVPDRRHRVGDRRAQGVDERVELSDRGLCGLDQGVGVVERRAEVDEGGVGVSHEAGELRDRLRQGQLLVPDRPHHQVEVPDQGRDVGGPLGEGAGEVRGVDDQALEGALVVGELTEQATGGGEERVGVLEALVGLFSHPVVGELEALDHALEVGDGVLVEGVEDLVEVDLGDGLGLVEGAALGDLLALLGVGRDGQLDLAVGDAREGVGANGGGGPPLEGGELVLDRERDQGLAVLPQLDRLHRAGRDAADDHLVAGHELRGVLELAGDLIRLVTAAEKQDDRDHGRDERDQHDDPAKRRRPSQLLPYPNTSWSRVRGPPRVANLAPA